MGGADGDAAERIVEVVAIVGSLRRGSLNRSLLRAAIEEAPPGLRVTEVPIRQLPIFDEDLEAAGDPEAVVAFKERLLAADALLVVTPEYNESLPGALKNAIDWASRRHGGQQVLAGKPAAIAGASSSRIATARCQQHLRHVLAHLGVAVMPKPDVMLGNAAGLFDEAGRLTDDRSRRQVAKLMEAFARWVERFGDAV